MKNSLILLVCLCSLIMASTYHGQTIGTKINTPFGTIRTISVLADDRIFAGTQSDGLFYSPDYGVTWINLTFPQNETGRVYKTNTGDLYVAAGMKGIYRNKNEAGVWDYVGFQDVKMGDMFESAIGNLIIHVSSYNSAVYSSVYTFYLSKDNGMSWKYIPSQFSESLALCFAKQPSGEIFIGTTKGVYKSTTGEYWTYCHPGSIYSIAIRSDGMIYIGLENELRTSSDDGANWSVFTFTQSPFEIEQIFRDTHDNMYVETSNISTSFLYKNSKSSNTWNLIGELNGHNGNSFANNMRINSLGDIFYLDSGSLYKISRTITAVHAEENIIPQQSTLYQNYPNPFNPTTTLKFAIPVGTMWGDVPTTLKVYDVLGREVVTLVNEEKAPGNYEVKFDGTNLASGVYFCQLQAGGFVDTKKIMLLK